jgi:hypothetical protein
VLASSSSTCACHEDGKKQHGFHAEKLHHGSWWAQRIETVVGHKSRSARTEILDASAFQGSMQSASRTNNYLCVSPRALLHRPQLGTVHRIFAHIHDKKIAKS